MKPVWKWIIGIVVGLIVVAALVGAAFLVHGYLMSGHVVAAIRLPAPNTGQGSQGNQPRGFGMPGNRVPNYRMPGNGTPYYGMPGFGWHRHGMMGFGPMMPFGGMIFGLFCLGLLALLVIGIVWLVRRPRAVQPVAAPVLSACPKCGKPVQADWNNCAYCGKKL